MAAQILRQTVQFLHTTVYQTFTRMVLLRLDNLIVAGCARELAQWAISNTYSPKSYTSTSATPVMLFTPRTIAV